MNVDSLFLSKFYELEFLDVTSNLISISNPINRKKIKLLRNVRKDEICFKFKSNNFLLCMLELDLDA